MADLGQTASASPAAPDLNLRLLRHLTRYLHDQHGSTALRRVAVAGGITEDDLQAGSRWVSHSQFEALLAEARLLMRDDEQFKAACSYKLGDVSGPVRLIIGAITPAAAYELGARNMKLISTVSAFEPERQQHGRVFIRYRSTKRESRLMCLSRQAQITDLPTLWGLPPANIVEQSCIAHGDQTCGYVVRVYEPRRWLPAAVGAAVGGALGMALHFLGVPWPYLAWATAATGAAIGYVFELGRAARANRITANEVNAAYLEVAREEADARRELFDFSTRHRLWGQLMEQQLAARTEVLKQLAIRLATLQSRNDRPDQARASLLSTLHTNLTELRGAAAEMDPRSIQLIEELDQAVRRLDTTLDELMDVATDQSKLVSLCPRTLATEPLTEDLRGRLAALVRGRDVRSSVFAVRETPPRVRLDAIVFNRIVDSLLTNAVRQTERGSILVEVGGIPGFLAIKVSDTGRGIAEVDVERIFSAQQPIARGTSAVAPVVADLWVVAQLLVQLGGRLEIKSTSQQGATVWAYFPVGLDDKGPSDRPLREPSESPVDAARVSKGSADVH